MQGGLGGSSDGVMALSASSRVSAEDNAKISTDAWICKPSTTRRGGSFPIIVTLKILHEIYKTFVELFYFHSATKMMLLEFRETRVL